MKYHDKTAWHELPPKRNLVLFVEMDQYQSRLYEEACQRTDSRAGDDKRKIASHPQLVDRFVHSEGASGMNLSL